MGAKTMSDPLLLIEVLSPSNEAITRANVWTYITIPSVQEILLLRSLAIGGELLHRGPDGTWSEAPTMLDDRARLELTSIGFNAPLRDLYRTTSLAR
jgi:Uma2 family endonuclease